MKKFSKICLILCLVFLGIGAVCAGVGIAMGSGVDEVRTMVRNGEFSIGGRYWNEDYVIPDEDNTVSSSGPSDIEDTSASHVENGTYVSKNVRNATYPADQVSSLDVDLKCGEVEFIDSSSDQIEININAPTDFIYESNIKSGTLKLIEKTKDYKLSNKKVNVSIAIPAGKTFEYVTISTNAGEIAVNHAFAARVIDLDLDAGKIWAQELNASDSLDVTVNAGSIQIDKMQAKEAEFSCDAGEIIVAGRVEGDISAECGIGRISMDLEGSVENYNYELDNNIGQVNINGEHYSSYLKQHHSEYYQNHSSDGRHNRDDSDDDEYYMGYDAQWDMELNCGLGQIDITIQ